MYKFRWKNVVRIFGDGQITIDVAIRRLLHPSFDSIHVSYHNLQMLSSLINQNDAMRVPDACMEYVIRD